MDDTTKKITTGVGVGSAGTIAAIAMLLTPVYTSMQTELKEQRNYNRETWERLIKLEMRHERLIAFQEWQHGRSEQIEALKRE